RRSPTASTTARSPSCAREPIAVWRSSTFSNTAIDAGRSSTRRSMPYPSTSTNRRTSVMSSTNSDPHERQLLRNAESAEAYANAVPGCRAALQAQLTFYPAAHTPDSHQAPSRAPRTGLRWVRLKRRDRRPAPTEPKDPTHALHHPPRRPQCQRRRLSPGRPHRGLLERVLRSEAGRRGAPAGPAAHLHLRDRPQHDRAAVGADAVHLDPERPGRWWDLGLRRDHRGERRDERGGDHHL